jgi:S-DNA-T family DNA segregation ATPase FtsK/SpoIIIE
MALPLFAPRRVTPGDSAPALPTNTRSPAVLGSRAATQPRVREIAALLLWTGAVFLTLALASFEHDPATSQNTGADWVGPVGWECGRILVSLIGIAAWTMPFEALVLGIPFVRGQKSNITIARFAGNLLILVTAAALVQVGWPGQKAFGGYPASGAVGELFGEFLRSLFSTIGSFLVGFACLGLILIGRASFSFIALMRWLGKFGAQGARGTAASAKSVADAWKTARDLDREKKEQARLADMPRIGQAEPGEATIAVLPEDDPLGDAEPEESPSPEPAADLELDALVIAPPEPKKRRPRKPKAAPVVEPPVEEEATVVEAAAVEEEEAVEEEDVEKPKRARKKAEPTEPTIVDTSAALEKEVAPALPPKQLPLPIAKSKDRMIPALGEGFRLPSIDFLAPGVIDPTLIVDKETLLKNADLLVKTLADYGVSGKVEDILPGPTVTTFEVSPAAGTKVSKVASLADDLALALARKVRIVAPIPGKNRIGFELPNERRVPVNLRDLVEDRRFQTLDAPLPVVLGRDILGNPVYADLASMPHVIVAGATGAGKSVGLNVMLSSLLYRRTPEELRLLMIDPKVVELAPFDRIPHMLLPVVTDMKQAATALKWAVDEMERRYQLFADAGTKNISTYNAWAGKVARGEIRNPLPKVVIAKDHNGLEEAIRPDSKDGEEGEAPLPEKLPLIVIVVDEFADLMMQQGKEVEAAVARLAQKARAAGMHVILATQRPSVDVITGMIKANFPTRVAFRVAQKVDSRTILDEQGAEHLLGRGDMLIKLNGTNETKRVQCPMITEEEVQAITDFLRLQGEPVYDENILKPRDDEAQEEEEDAEQDAMYDQAVRLVADTRRCSTSWIQRKLGLGYNRAARIVEMMERRGLVGPANGAKDREVLIESI